MTRTSRTVEDKKTKLQRREKKEVHGLRKGGACIWLFRPRRYTRTRDALKLCNVLWTKGCALSVGEGISSGESPSRGCDGVGGGRRGAWHGAFLRPRGQAHLRSATPPLPPFVGRPIQPIPCHPPHHRYSPKHPPVAPKEGRGLFWVRGQGSIE